MSRAALLHMPRWEWRTFSPFRPDLPKETLDQPGADSIDSHEIRILCSRSMHDVLIHGESIRLKWRKQVGPGGLELWDSILKDSFPCSAPMVLRLFEAWGVPTPRLGRSAYSRDQLLEEVLARHPDLIALAVYKQSRVFAMYGATCELSELSIDQLKLTCFSVEHEDPALALQVIHHLGLETRTNTSYPQGLKTALHFPQPH